MFIISLYKIFIFSLPTIIVKTIIHGKNKETGINGSPNEGNSTMASATVPATVYACVAERFYSRAKAYLP
jgi:hypothetical protein